MGALCGRMMPPMRYNALSVVSNNMVIHVVRIQMAYVNKTQASSTGTST